MRILFLSRWFPWPPDNGSKLRVYNILRGLAQAHEVTLLTFLDRPGCDPNACEIRSLCPDLQTVEWKPFQPRSPRALAGFLSRVPRSVVDTYSTLMEQKIREVISAGKHDLVIASQEGTAVYGHCFNGVPALFEEIELGVLYERYANAAALPARFRSYLTWTKQRHHLRKVLRHFRAGTVVSEKERSLLATAVPNIPPIEIIPNCVDLASYASVPGNPRPDRLIFIGAFTYAPNHDAMVWFLRDAYPRLREKAPGVHLTITGDHANLPLPPAKGVTCTGRVEDVRQLVADSWVSIVPILAGGGTRLKILESMALGTPVVATTKGAEGLDVEDGRHLLIADSPSDFAGAIARILQDPSLRSHLARNAFELISGKYDWTAVMPRLLGIVERVARG